jgi:hypothetical protein
MFRDLNITFLAHQMDKQTPAAVGTAHGREKCHRDHYSTCSLVNLQSYSITRCLTSRLRSRTYSLGPGTTHT